MGRFPFRQKDTVRKRRFFPSFEERAEHGGPPSLEVDFPLESAIQQSLDTLLRFRPRQGGLKRGESVEEPGLRMAARLG